MAWTKDKFNEYQQRRYRERMDEAIAYLGGCCVRCGSAEALELDHVDRSTKTAAVSSMHLLSKVRFMAEVEKCQVLCKTCHGVKSVEERHSPREHGTTAMYQAGCRCAYCTQANRDYSRVYMREKRRHACGAV